MKVREILIVLFTVCLLGSSVLAARVTNVNLEYQNGSTLARIDVDGTVRFTHQTEVAKDGKPFRVIIDVLSATHQLGAKNFMRLPNCSVVQIRTSQYSVQPEKICRIVFDMKNETVYQIDSDESSIRLLFTEKNGRSFSPWSTAAVVAALKAEIISKSKLAAKTDEPAPTKKPVASAAPGEKSANYLNKSIEKDRLASLDGGESSAKSKSRSTTAKIEKPEITKESVDRAFRTDTFYEPEIEPTSPVTKPVVKTSDIPQNQQTVKQSEKTTAVSDVKTKKKELPVESKTAPPPKKKAVFVESGTSSTTKEAGKTQIASNKPAETATVVKKQTTKNNPASTTVAKKQTTKQKPVVKVEKTSKPAASDKKKVVAKKSSTSETNSKDTKRSTARFRRSAEDSKKIKGTLVAEFPKRLVIKYKTRKSRDPFETLVNETKTNNSVIERKIPNVEGIRLVGVIESSGGDNRALFEDNEGYGYILKSGDKVQKGYVLRIEVDRVYFQIFEYGWSRTVALKLE